MTKTITATYTGTVTAITPKTIVVFLPALALEGDVPMTQTRMSKYRN